MTNAKEELLYTLKNQQNLGKEYSIKCAIITHENMWDEEKTKTIVLKEDYTPTDYVEFLDRLNFDYDSGYGGQELYGTVWLTKENTWLSRGEYDGSEWWEYNECPKVPDELKSN